MNTSDKIFIKLRRSLIYILAIFIVTIAVALSIARIVLPQIQGYRESVQATLGELIQQKVTIRTVDARLVGFTPTLIFKDVKMMDDSGKEELISFSETHLGIAVLQSIVQKTLVPSNFGVVGTTISILQDKDNRFIVQGFDVSSLVDPDRTNAVISAELANWLMEQASISVRDSTVVLKLNRAKKLHRFEKVDLILHNRGERHQLTGSFNLPDTKGKKAKLALDVTGDLTKPEKWKGLAYLDASGLRLSSLNINPEFKNLQIKDGVSDVTLWGEWTDLGLENISGKVSLKNMEIVNNKNNQASIIDQLNTQLDWQKIEMGWEMRLSGIEFVRGKSVWRESAITTRHIKDINNLSQFDFNMQFARIEDIRQLLLDSNLYTGQYNSLLMETKPQGEVSNLNIQYKQISNSNIKYHVTADVSKFGISSTEKMPGLYGLNAYININEMHGKIDIDGKDLLFSHPRIFRESIGFDAISASLKLLNSGNGWFIKTDNVVAKNSEMNMIAGAMAYLPEKKKSKYLDIQLAFKDVDITKIHRYQPTIFMKQKLVNWIDTSFIQGKVLTANMAYRGWSHEFPFRQYAGVLNGDFHTKDVSMYFFPDWPKIDKVEAKGEYTNRGITVRAIEATLHGGSVKNLVVNIDDFKKPILVASGDAYSSTHDGFHFFSKTPPGKRTKRFVEKTIFKGNVHTNMTFSVALDKELAKKYKKRFSGYVETSDSEFHMMHNRMPVTEVNGRVYFSDEKHHAEGVTAKIMQGPAEIWVTSKIVGIKPVASIHGKGHFDSVMLDRNFKKLGLMRVYGRLPWEGAITLGHQRALDPDDREPAKMWLKSDLVGVEIDMPEPFKKASDVARTSIMRSTFLPEIKTILNIQYGDRMSTEMRLNNNYFPARIEIGEMKLSAGKAKLPDKDEFRLSGVVSNADQYKWREIMQEHYNKYRKLRTRPIVDVPVMVDFAYVSVPFDKEKAKPRKRYTSPIIMPAFKGQVRQFVFAGKKVGKVEFDSRKDKYGLVYDMLKVTSPDMEYNGTMTWHYVNDWHKTKAKGKFKIKNLGNLVKNFGMKDKAEDGEGEITIDLNWENPFYVVRPGYTDGKVNLALEDGVVSAINPGAGRFLGLLNISTLPRRLLLDFKDVGSGFAYDTIKGTIDLKNGIAKTSDLAVDSTVADILAVGKVDIRKKEFDQIVTVTPQVMGTMPVVSGLLMGTGVIPIVWLFERMFGSDMDKSLSRQYHVKGPWGTPVVERIDKDKDEEEE